jgi:hypothetical protein
VDGGRQAEDGRQGRVGQETGPGRAGEAKFMTRSPHVSGKVRAVRAVAWGMNAAVIVLLIVALSGALLAAVNHVRQSR